MCRILSQLTRLLRLEPDSLEAHAASLRLVCREQAIHSPVLGKAVVSLYVQASCPAFSAPRPRPPRAPVGKVNGSRGNRVELSPKLQQLCVFAVLLLFV